jgi:hypothetical protein
LLLLFCQANAVLMSLRTFGNLGSPFIGSALVWVGGPAAPMLFVALVTLLLYSYFTFVMVPKLQGTALYPPACPEQASPFALLRICPAWNVWALLQLFYYGQFSIEPLYNPILSGEPYNLNVLFIGLWVLIAPASGIISAMSTAGMYAQYGVPAVLWTAAAMMCTGYVLLGPSKLLPGVSPSFGLLATALVFQGAGAMMGIMMTPRTLRSASQRRHDMEPELPRALP